MRGPLCRRSIDMVISLMHHALIPKRCGNIREVPNKKRRGPLRGRAAGISRRRGSWLACRREIHLNFGRPAMPPRVANSYCQNPCDEQRTLCKRSIQQFSLDRIRREFRFHPCPVGDDSAGECGICDPPPAIQEDEAALEGQPWLAALSRVGTVQGGAAEAQGQVAALVGQGVSRVRARSARGSALEIRLLCSGFGRGLVAVCCSGCSRSPRQMPGARRSGWIWV